MRLIAFSLSVVLLALLAGCVTLGGSAENAASDQSPAAEQQAMLFQPEPGLTPKERYLKSLSLLEVGQAGQAKAELLAYLAEDPGGRYANRSKDLLQQIGTDPQKALGKEHFLYKMQAGDSLSSVAKQYLGDPLKFHLLARYNELENPSQMKAGQTIKVPGKRPAAAPVEAAQPAPEPSSDTEPQASAEEASQDREAAQDDVAAAVESGDTAQQPDADSDGPADRVAEQKQSVVEEGEAIAPALPDTAVEDTQVAHGDTPSTGESEAMETEVEQIQSLILEAEEFAGAGDYQAAARQYESGLDRFPEATMMKQLAAANYVTFADQLSSKGRLEEAGTALERAAQLDPESKEVQQRLANLGRQGEANQYYLKGKELLTADKPLEAFEAFDEAVKIVPDHPAAVERANLIPVVTEEWHRKAMIFFRRQDLDAALGIWDTKVLTIDPTYGPALLYRDQAIDLKERLENLPSEQPAAQQ